MMLLLIGETDLSFTYFQKLEEKRRKQIMTSIQKNVQQAKATGDDKRYGQVASRKKVRTIHFTQCLSSHIL